ncbi:MAG TPA: hypothetical protein ENH51_02075, partial [Euryarchaeota archaeon]|nr:hypothetical protein [Euryarchaeota archaeon]
MVNLKKISAIATGALFVGATLGTASAAFSGSMLASGGVAKAKLVVSTQNPDASGNAADKAAANTVNNAVSAANPCAGSSGGANCQYEYEGQDFDNNDSTKDDVTKTEVKGIHEGYWIANKTSGSESTLNLTSWELNASEFDSEKGFWFDANGDGKIDSSDDYIIKNDIKIIERKSTELTVMSALRLGNCEALEKKIIKIRGQKYYVKKFDAGADELTLIPVDEKTLLNSKVTQDMMDSALLIPGTDIKIGLQNLNVTNGTLISAQFAIIEGGVVTSYHDRDLVQSDPPIDKNVDMELLSNYVITIQYADPGSEFITLSIGKKSDEFKIADGDTNVLGYAKAAVDSGNDW